MNRYLIKPGIRGMFCVNEDMQLSASDYVSTDIDWVYLVPEDGILNVQLEDNETVTYPVSKDNLVIVFYKRDGQKQRVIVLDNKQWIENINGIKEESLKRAKKYEEDTNENCESIHTNTRA